MRRSTAIVFLVIMVLLFNVVWTWGGDPSGVETLAKDPGKALDFVWILLCGFLVMFMQAGFACLESGFCRAKNVTNLMTKNLLDFVAGSLAFWAVGFGIIMGTDWMGLIGTSNFFLAGDTYDVNTYLSFFWQMVFAATAVACRSWRMARLWASSIFAGCLTAS